MEALSVTPLDPAAVPVVRALRPLAIPAPVASQRLTAQDLAQDLFQQSLQTAANAPLPEPAGGLLRLAPEATASVLASLGAPQSVPASVGSSPLPSIPETASTAPASNPPANPVGTLPLSQEASLARSSEDLALEGALRVGSAVTGSSAQAPAPPSQETDLVRGAASVVGAGTVEPQAGGPGPEAFLRAQANTNRILRDYQQASVPPQPQPAGLDLLA